MTARRSAVHPGAATDAANAAAAPETERAPHTLTEAEVMLLPGKTVLELGNAGKLQHIGLGIPPARTTAPKKTATRPPKASLTEAQMARMDGNALSKAMAAGLVPGVGARRKRRH